MNATTFRFQLTERPSPAATPRRRILQSSRVVGRSRRDAVEEWIDGALHILLAGALAFALGAFVLAM